MKNQALFSSKDKSKKLKCHLLQFSFGTLRVSMFQMDDSVFTEFLSNSYQTTRACVEFLRISSPNLIWQFLVLG